MKLGQKEDNRILLGKAGFLVTSVIKCLPDNRYNSILMSIWLSLEFCYLQVWLILKETKNKNTLT